MIYFTVPSFSSSLIAQHGRFARPRTVALLWITNIWRNIELVLCFSARRKHVTQPQRHKWPAITTIYTSSRNKCLWNSSLVRHALLISPQFLWQKFHRR